MKVQINSSGSLSTSPEDRATVVAVLNDHLGRFDDFLRRIEVHLHPCGPSGGAGHRIECGLEARFAGKRPLKVHHADRSVEQAVSRAARKMLTQLDRRFSRRSTVTKKGHVRNIGEG
ncbi:hypothetical protein U5801_07700 [Lamprobacter modestohalophilus]|uniref:hypothetical protein n=1 Tax=Lamprobacter modestohalophilus TaxID=1064514 RepID=UPI002ADEB952|nr:hypothetical protein [Lamprobacter modestohalophilus]MEA1049689.1 hypothetical protein [Lamprobacter modestohalophilus]